LAYRMKPAREVEISGCLRSGSFFHERTTVRPATARSASARLEHAVRHGQMLLMLTGRGDLPQPIRVQSVKALEGGYLVEMRPVGPKLVVA